MAAPNKRTNPYTVCIAEDQHNRLPEDFMLELNARSPGVDSIIYYRPCHNDKEQGHGHNQKYILCLKKEFNDAIEQDEHFTTQTGISVKRLSVDKNPPANNLTYGFFIKTDRINPQEVINIFLNLEQNNFIISGSYEILYPKPYPDGTDRNYLVVTFKKVNNNYPKNFIKKLKTLLNNTKIGDSFLKIKWVSNSVLRDIRKGETKEIKKAINSSVSPMQQ